VLWSRSGNTIHGDFTSPECHCHGAKAFRSRTRTLHVADPPPRLIQCPASAGDRAVAHETERPKISGGAINLPDNLVLLCAACDKLIDDRPDDYPRALVETFKQEHEERIRPVMGSGQACSRRVCRQCPDRSECRKYSCTAHPLSDVASLSRG
jgi:hypothetical protein